MKNICLICSILFLSANLAKTQIHIGVGGKVSVPTKNSYFIDYGGIGFNMAAGYLIKQRLDVTIMAENIWFHSVIKGFKISSLQANFKYMIIKKPFKPYVGFSAGVYETSYVGFWSSQKINQPIYFGFMPAIGAWFDSGWVNGLFINPELSYYYLQTNNKLNPINFNIGFLYYFEKK